MKTRLLAILAATACAATAYAGTAPTDTIMSVSNPHHIVITEDSAGLNVSVRGADNDSTFRTSFTELYPDDTVIHSHQTDTEPWWMHRRKHSDWAVGAGGLMLGFTDAVGAPSAMRQEMGKSFEIGLAEAISVNYMFPGDRWSVGAGFGFTWRNYRTTLGTRYMSDGQGTGVMLEPWPDDVEGRFSRLKVFSLNFPVTAEYRAPFRFPGSSRRLAIKGSVIFNCNSHASLKSAWTDATGRDVMYTTNSIGQRKFTMDFMLTVMPMPYLGIYCKYSPMSVLNEGHGPDFRSFSTGLILLY